MVIVIHLGYQSENICIDSLHKKALGGTETAALELAINFAENKNNKVYVTGDVDEYTDGNLVFTKYYNGAIDYLIGVAYINFLKVYEFNKVGKNILWLHNEEYYPWHEGKELPDHRMYLSYLDQVVCVSEWHMNETIKRYPELARRCTYIYNGVNTSSFNSETHDKVVGSCIFSSHPERDLDKAVRAFYDNPEYTKLHICMPDYGVKYFRENYSHLLKASDIEVHGALPKEKLYELMAKCEYWLYPSGYRETFCITAVEMMGHGVKPRTSLEAALAEVVGPAYDLDEMLLLEDYAERFDWINIMPEWYKLFVDKSYVISMRTSREDCEAKYSKLELETPLTYVEAHTPHKTDIEFTQYRGWEINSDNDWWNRPVTQGEIGCALSHMSIWRSIVQSGTPLALVLEEDFEVLDTIPSKVIAEMANCDLMYLGRNAVHPDQEERKHFVVPGYSYNTHAYLITLEGAKKMLDNNFQNNIFAVDEFMSATYSDHPREDVRGLVWKDVSALSVKKEIIKQTSNSHNSTTAHMKDFSIITGASDWDAFVKRNLHPAAISKSWDLVVDEPIQDVISFPLFKKEFCQELIMHLNEENKWVYGRHQYYPTIDVLLSSVGLDDMYTRVLKEYVYPCAINFWTLEGNRYPNLVPENFAIKYTDQTQGHLDLHHDDGTFSCVMALNDEFTGGGTYFYRQKETHVGNVGHITIHPAQITHRHGARPVEQGERYVIVTFCR